MKRASSDLAPGTAEHGGHWGRIDIGGTTSSEFRHDGALDAQELVPLNVDMENVTCTVLGAACELDYVRGASLAPQ